jgi:predicted dehydrogenase
MGHTVVGFDPRPPGKPEPWPRAGSLAEAIDEAHAVVVATPNSLHAEPALAALERDRHVLVEKPLAVEPADAAEIVNVARARNLVCGVAMNLRFHPAIETIRGLLGAGRLGSIRFAQVSCGSDLQTWRAGTDYRAAYSAQAALGGGIVRDAVHELDYLTWLLGPAASITAEAGHISELEIDVEDVAAAVLRMTSGSIAAVDLTYVDPAYRRGCLLVGALATARWEWSRGTIEIRSDSAEPERVDVRADVGDTYVRMMKDFLAAVDTGGSPRTTAREGCEMVRLADAFLRSAREGRRILL